MGDESPHQDDAFWSLAVNSERPNRADRPNPSADVPVDRVVRERSDEATHAEPTSGARTLRFARPRLPATSTREAAVSDQAAGGNRTDVADQQAAAVVSRAQSQIQSYRAQLEASRRKAAFWDAVTHPVAVAIGSLTFFSLIAMLWLQDPVVRPPAPDGGPIAMAPAETNPSPAREPATGAPTAAVTEPRPTDLVPPTSEAVTTERPVGTSGIAPADTASAAVPVPPVPTRTAPDLAAASAPESNTAPAASEVRAVSAAPEVRSAPAAPEPSVAPAAPAPPPAPAAAPETSTQTVSAAPVAPPNVPVPATVETPRPGTEPIDQPAAAAAARGEEPQPPGAAPGGAGLREAVLVSGPLPRYPGSVKRIGQVGAVDVDLTIDPLGRVTRAEALNGPKLLQGFAEDAVLKWRYEPAVSNGVPVESRRRVRIVFR